MVQNSANWHLNITSQTELRFNPLAGQLHLEIMAVVPLTVCVWVFAPPHLEVWLLEDPGQFGRAVVFNLETADVAQDLRHQLHIVVLHRLQLHFLQLFVSLGGRRRHSGRADGWVLPVTLWTDFCRVIMTLYWIRFTVGLFCSISRLSASCYTVKSQRSICLYLVNCHLYKYQPCGKQLNGGKRQQFVLQELQRSSNWARCTLDFLQQWRNMC